MDQDQNQVIFKIDQFEGPLDLLLALVAKNKMRIEDVPISLLCDQYIEYIGTLQTKNIEIAAEFIVMASELMYIKSKILLPREDEDQEDSAELLRERLIERARAKEASKQLAELFELYHGRMEKDTDEISPDKTYVADDQNIKLLSSAFIKVMTRIKITDEEAAKNITPLISSRTISVEERVYAILRLLLLRGGKVPAIDCFNGVDTMHELVATFMAILEMLKAGRLLIYQDELSQTLDGIINLEDNVYLELFEGKIRSSEEGNTNGQ